MPQINFLRNKLSQSRYKPVSLDAFTFSVFEEEADLRRSSSLREKICYSDLNDLFSEKEDLAQVLESLLSWYKEKYPQLDSEEILDYVKRLELSPLFAGFVLDLKKAFHHFKIEYPFTDPVPEPEVQEEELASETFDSEEVKSEEPILEKTDDEESSDLEEKVDSDVLASDETETLAVEDEMEESLEEEKVETPVFLRSEFESLLKSHFSHYYDYYLACLDWFHCQALASEMDFDSTPPSGRALLTIRRAFPQSELVWGKNLKNQKPIFSSSSPSAPQKSSRQEEKKAMDEVHAAVKKLKRDKRVASVQLEPQNSFIRRLQHKVVHKNDFDSKSVGKEPERYLQIIRKKK